MTKPIQDARYPAWGAYFTDLSKDLPSQEVLDKLKESQTMVSRWTRGSACPNIARAKEVATALGGSPEDAEKAIRADTIKTVTSSKPVKKAPAKKRTTRKAAAAARTTPTRVAQARPGIDPLERVRASQRAIAAAERELDEAVDAARHSGVPWTKIAGVLAG